MVTSSQLLGLDPVCFKLNINIPLHWKHGTHSPSETSPNCLLLKTLLKGHYHTGQQQVNPNKKKTWFDNKRQVSVIVSWCLATPPLVPIWKNSFRFSVPNVLSQKTFPFPHLYWIKKRKCRTDLLPGMSSFPRDTILQWSKFSSWCANFGFIKNIHDHPS